MTVPQTEIIIRKDGTEVERRVVAPGEYIIGRGEDCAFQVVGEKVSRHHARLFVSYQDWSIADLGSANGTQLNEEPVGEAAVKVWPSQIIRVGDATIELRALVPSDPDATLMPTQETVRRHLPPELQSPRRYQIGKQIAQGGMGAILSAADQGIRREVAMKVMLKAMDPGDILRFIEEAQVTGQLEHPSIVPVYELSVNEQGEVFYTMKMVRGITLKKVIELLAKGVGDVAKKYPLAALLTIFQKVCDAIAFAHSKGVIHRDLKPENIMLGDYGEVLVMDWGLARLVGSTERATVVRSAKADEGDAMRTQTGTIMGTPTYMSPEQARGEIEKLDARSDIYALGTILFELLHLRPVVTGADVMQVVSKVQRGAVEWGTDKTQIPASLLAVCRKALALTIPARYPRVEDLQADLLAFQNGFATSAEQAGLGRLLLLALKRNKIAAGGIAAVLLVGSILGTKAVIEGRRAERGEAKANAALADLKASAPALLQLAKSEADSQRFASALGKLDAALALDPALLRARWQRAWVLLAMERWSESADALRLARQHDPAGAQLASILPAVEKVAAAPEAERWKSDDAREVFAHLQTVEATGPALAFSGKLKLGAEERRKLADQRLLAALGNGNHKVSVENDGLVAVDVNGKALRSFEAFRSLPIENLMAYGTQITHLEPLRGMRLHILDLGKCGAIADLTPLRGMPLRILKIEDTLVRDLSPLSGMSLSKLNAQRAHVADLTPLSGMPLTELDLGATRVSRIDALRGMRLVTLSLRATRVEDCSPLDGAPIQTLNIGATKVSDLSFAKGMPLRWLHAFSTAVSTIDALRGLPLEDLNLNDTPITDLSPLQGAPLKHLRLRGCKKLTDYTPVLTLARLERLNCDVLPAALLPLRESATLQSIEADAYPGEGSQGARPVAEFWTAYDTWKAKQPK